jgi:hypothetical protein
MVPARDADELVLAARALDEPVARLNWETEHYSTLQTSHLSARSFIPALISSVSETIGLGSRRGRQRTRSCQRP